MVRRFIQVGKNKATNQFLILSDIGCLRDIRCLAPTLITLVTEIPVYAGIISSTLLPRMFAPVMQSSAF